MFRLHIIAILSFAAFNIISARECNITESPLPAIAVSADSAAIESIADSVATASVSISHELSVPDPETGARVIVNQSEAITGITERQTSTQKRETRGYRIQIFSNNRGAEAKTKAFKIKENVQTKNPDLDVYVTYTSPFWKVRIGNCETHEEAQKLRTEIIRQFPEYAPETYIVPSTVLVR